MIPGLPARHREFLDGALEALAADPMVLGVGGAGSLVADGGARIDRYSDVDLVIAVADADRAAMLGRMVDVAAAVGPLLSQFSGDHVGEPERLLICLYGPPLLHVDMKFVSLSELADRVEDPVVLFERDGAMSAVLAATRPSPPALDLDWLGDRFWTWIHYGTDKALRGELLTCLDMLAFVRRQVLGAMALYAAGYRGIDAQGLRRIETLAPRWAARLEATVADLDRDRCLAALAACCEVYDELCAELGFEGGGAEQAAVREYLAAQL